MPATAHRTRVPRPRLRTVAAVAGLILATLAVLLAAKLIGASGTLEGVVVDGDPVFAPPPALTQPPPLPPDGDTAQRTLSVKVATGAEDDSSATSGPVRGVVEATATLELDGDHPFARYAAEGRFRTQGRNVASAVAGLEATLDGTPTYLPWTDPTVHTLDGDRVRITTRATSVGHEDKPDTVRLQLDSTYCDQPCRTTVKVTATDWNTTAVRPSTATTRRSSDAVTLTLESTDPTDTGTSNRTVAAATVTLTSDEAPVLRTGPEPAPAALTGWATAVALAGWALLPWWVLRRRLLLDTATTGQLPQRDLDAFRRSTSLLLTLGVIGIAVISTNYVDQLARWATDSAIPTQGWRDTAVRVLRTAAQPAGLALLAVWAWRARTSLHPPGVGRVWAWLWWLLAVSCATTLVYVAVTQETVTQQVGGRTLEVSLSFGAEPELLLLGVAVALIGLLPFALGPSPGRLAGLVLGVSVLVLAALMVRTYSTTADWVAGAGTTVVDIATVTAAMWVAAHAATPGRVRAWRRSTWLRWAVVVVAALMVTPPVFGGATWLSVYDTMQVGYLLRLLLQLLLLSCFIGVLVGYGTRLHPGATLARPVAVWIAAALLLRPDDLFAGVPWPLLVGLILIVTVLLPRSGTRPYPVRPLRPAVEQNRTQQARALFDLSTAIRLERDTQQNTRRKVASGDLDPVKADQVRSLVKAATAAPSHIPADDADALDAWSWAGEPLPARRALAGALLGGALGAVLLLATLASALSHVDGFLGLAAWSPVLGLLVSFRFPWYGFVFGYLYPAIPGRTGLAKAARLFVVVAASETVALLVPLDTGADRGAVVLRLLQVALLCFALGMAADHQTLRWAGLGGARVGDLYGTYRFAVWSSGIAVAAGTTLATAMLGSAATALLQNVLPEKPPSTPPPAAAQP